MSMTVVVTRNVADRFRGFLASVMLEIAPGVYTSPRLTRAVRERVWLVMCDWHAAFGGGSIIMTWRDREAPGGQAMSSLGEPPRHLEDADGLMLVKRVFG